MHIGNTFVDSLESVQQFLHRRTVVVVAAAAAVAVVVAAAFQNLDYFDEDLD